MKSIQAYLEAPKVNWNRIYFDIQAAGISDSRFHGRNFKRQPVWIIREMKARIDERDCTLANAYSMSTAKIGLAFAPKGTPLQYFLPFLLKTEDDELKPKTKISKQTAEIFVHGVKTRVIPHKVIAAMSPYIEEIYALVE